MGTWGRRMNGRGGRSWRACLALVVAFTVAWPGLSVYAADEGIAAEGVTPVEEVAEAVVPAAEAAPDTSQVAAEDAASQPDDTLGESQPEDELKAVPVVESAPDGQQNGATGCIAVYKFRDDDRDQHKDPWEPWVEGWEFTLYDHKGMFIESGTTNEHGELCFTSVPVGEYLVRETLREGWIPVTPQNQEVRVSPWQTSHLWFANAFQTGCIAVYKFQDSDRDQHKDPGEQWLEGWEFTLYDAQGTFVASGATNERGELCFSSVPVGEYLVRETLPSGWVNITPIQQSVLVCDWQTTHIWFANDVETLAPETGDLLVHNFEDLDRDGVLDPGEPMLEDWQFSVFGAEAAILDSGTTGPDGTLLFEDLMEGEVSVVQTLESGWTSTTGTTADATIVAGETAEVFFGNVREAQAPATGTLRIEKFRDTNENMAFDPGEPLLSGWSFTVRDGAGAAVATGTTNALGTLELVLPVGTYTVTETLVAGWLNTTPLSQTVIVVENQTVTARFGNVEEPSLPFTETPSEPFLPFTGGELALLLAAATASGAVGLTLRVKGRKAA